jgi:hypothetical protein
LTSLTFSRRAVPGNYEQLFLTAHRVNYVRRASLPTEVKYPRSFLDKLRKNYKGRIRITECIPRMIS